MMKLIATGLLIMANYCLFATQGIVVTQKYTGADVNKDASVTVTWYVTATQCKMKMEYHDSKVNSVTWFIPDLANNQMLTYADGPAAAGTQKTYFAIPVQTIKPTVNTSISRINLQQSSETKTVSGVSCQKMVMKTNRGTTEMWVTDQFKPDFYKFFAYFQNSTELMALNNEGVQGFPVESTTRDITGAVTGASQLVSLSQVQLQDSDFQVPADYQLAK